MERYTNITSLPVKGLDYSEWETSDLRAWDRIVAGRMKNPKKPMTDREMETVTVLNKKYRIKKFYSFT